MAELAASETSVLERAKGESRIIMMIDPADIQVDPLVRDRDLDAARKDSDFAELVDDIRDAGIKTPLVVRTKPEGGLLLVEGLRRLAAAREIGLDRVPVIERRYETEDAALEDMLRENLMRQNPPPMETALLFAHLLERGWDEKRITGLLRAKSWTISRVRTVARAFMPWLAVAYPAYRSLPFMEMVNVAPVVEQNADRLSLLEGALRDLSAREEVRPKEVVDALRSVALTGVWASKSDEERREPEGRTPPRRQARSAFNAQGRKVALLTQHEGQAVIRFPKRVPDAVIEQVWARVEELLRETSSDDTDLDDD
jgi:ParB/RepB/Spo0J family partition protein